MFIHAIHGICDILLWVSDISTPLNFSLPYYPKRKLPLSISFEVCVMIPFTVCLYHKQDFIFYFMYRYIALHFEAFRCCHFSRNT